MFPKIKSQFSDDTQKNHQPYYTKRKKLKRSQYWSLGKDSVGIEVDNNKSKSMMKISTIDYQDYKNQSLTNNPERYQIKPYTRKIYKIHNQGSPHRGTVSTGCNNPKCRICKKYTPVYNRKYEYKNRLKLKKPIPLYISSAKPIKKVPNDLFLQHTPNKRKVVSVIQLRDEENSNDQQQYIPKYKDIVPKHWVQKIIKDKYEKYKTQPNEIKERERFVEVGGKLYEIIEEQSPNLNSKSSSIDNYSISSEKKLWKGRFLQKQKIREYLNKQISQYLKYDTIFYLKKTQTGYSIIKSPKIQKYFLKKGELYQYCPSTQSQSQTNLQHMDIDIKLKQYINSRKKNLYELDQDKKQIYSIKFPTLDNVEYMIRKYQSLTGQLDLQKLRKSRSFHKEYSSEPGQQYLYFGGWDFVSGVRNGYGVYMTKKIILEGHWIKGNIVRGAELRPQSLYKGQFKNFKKHGQGECRWLNREEYLGEWNNGVRHGHGFWSAKNGTETYSGQWRNGKVWGYGQYYKKNQSLYKGSFENFVKKGSGVQLFANGDRFQGDYLDGQPYGIGKYTWECGLQYYGNFKNGFRVGKGCLIKQDIFQLEGEFANEKPNGTCRLRLSNGDTYNEKFLFGQKFGYNSIQHSNFGSYKPGVWDQNALNSKINSQKYLYKNISTFF